MAQDSTMRTVAMIAGSQSGKGCSIATDIPTINGFVKMGDIKVGDMVFGADGLPHVVKFVSENHSLPCYRFTFSDGSSEVFDNEHLWRVQSRKQRKNSVRRLEYPDPLWIVNRPQCNPTPDYDVINSDEIYKNYLLPTANKNRTKPICNYSIDLPLAVQYKEQSLPIPPYTFGAWLGDGSSNSAAITCSEDECIIDRIKLEWSVVKKHEHSNRATSYSFATHKKMNGVFNGYLSDLGVLENKHIPEIYLTASVNQRIELLRGLLDTDGYCSKTGFIEFCSIKKELANGVFELVKSLGILARIRIGRSKLYGMDCGEKYQVIFTTIYPVFTIPRKLARLQKRKTLETSRLFITKIEKVESVITRCISVDSPNNLYLVGRSYIPTHNTSYTPWWLNKEIELRGGGDYIAVTASYDLFKLKFLPSMLAVFENILKIGRYWTGEKIIEIMHPEQGFLAKKSVDTMYARIILRSADAIGGLESSTAKAAVLDECGQIRFTYAAYKAINRRLSLYRGRKLLTTTLYDYDWVDGKIIDPVLRIAKTNVLKIGEAEIDNTICEEKSIQIIQYDSILNPLFSLDVYKEAEDSMSAEEFSMFYRGRKSKKRFRIYDVFDEDNHVIKDFEIPSTWVRYIGFDFGSANLACSYYAENPDNQILFCYRTYKSVQKAVKDHAEDILLGEINIALCCGGFKGEGQWRTEFGTHGIYIAEPDIVSVDVGISRVYAQNKLNKILYFEHGASDIIDQKKIYRRETDPETGELTAEIHDKDKFHFMDAERYIISKIRPGVPLYANVQSMADYDSINE